jgi:hypothetical protein
MQPETAKVIIVLGFLFAVLAVSLLKMESLVRAILKRF